MFGKKKFRGVEAQRISDGYNFSNELVADLSIIFHKHFETNDRAYDTCCLLIKNKFKEVSKEDWHILIKYMHTAFEVIEERLKQAEANEDFFAMGGYARQITTIKMAIDALMRMYTEVVAEPMTFETIIETTDIVKTVHI